jgi:MYXO-CTERM domain-containing protein
MRTKLALPTLLTVALVAPAALPCGAPFGNGINADPKQDIIVVHKNGTETYVFQPRFCGSAREFGLVLPVPSKLSAQPAITTTDVFTKLVALSQPQYQYVTQCSYGNGGGGSSGGTRADGGTGTTVVSSGTVGFMDYAQLDTVSVDALTAWLTQNGYPYDAQATAAFDYYVQKGWYFLTFKVAPGGIDAGASTCKDLGPVKLSFPTSIPVVPTRMATARSKDTSGVLSYATSFSWRIFGITEGSQQLGFANGASSSRVLNFSGLVSSSDVSSMAGLAVAGDRATKMTVTFSYGSTDPDIGLGLVAGQDYREVITVVSYIACNDGGVDSSVDARADSGADLPVDAAADRARPPEDTAHDPIRLPDTGPDRSDSSSLTRDATPDLSAPPVTPDATVVTPPPPEAKNDAGAPIVYADAAPASPDSGVTVNADASTAKNDAGATATEPASEDLGGGCSCTTSSRRSGIMPALALGLLLALRRRRR